MKKRYDRHDHTPLYIEKIMACLNDADFVKQDCIPDTEEKMEKLLFMTFLNGVAFGRLVSPEDAEEMGKQYCVEIKQEADLKIFFSRHTDAPLRCRGNCFTSIPHLRQFVKGFANIFAGILK